MLGSDAQSRVLGLIAAFLGSRKIYRVLLGVELLGKLKASLRGVLAAPKLNHFFGRRMRTRNRRFSRRFTCGAGKQTFSVKAHSLHDGE